MEDDEIMESGKLIFIVAPYFPPSALPPSQRVRLLVPHLREFGLEPVIFTVDQHYREENPDPWMLELVGQDYALVRVKCIDQDKSRKWGIGDIGLRMLPFLFFTLKREIKRKKPAMVLYPVPPWYVLLIAPLMKFITGVPYAIDYIDPWVFELKQKNFKARASQWIAKILEGRIVRSSALIFSVSQGILNDLVKRYPSVGSKTMVALPYGVELNDYASFAGREERGRGFTLVRYIGAVSDASVRVVKAMLNAIKLLAAHESLQVEFIGTSYAGKGLAQPRLRNIIDELQLSDTVTEFPDRVTYRKALELTMNADILLIFGDMTVYYAASKLMGLVASGKPFIAFVHRESFPAEFLRSLNYPFLVQYSDTPGETPEEKIGELRNRMAGLILNRQNFQPIDKHHPSFETHTAEGMTKIFADNIKKALTI